MLTRVRVVFFTLDVTRYAFLFILLFKYEH